MQLTHCYFAVGDFDFLYFFFQEAQDYADGNNIIEIFMEVSALTGENVKDLFSKVGQQNGLFIDIKG